MCVGVDLQQDVGLGVADERLRGRSVHAAVHDEDGGEGMPHGVQRGKLGYAQAVAVVAPPALVGGRQDVRPLGVVTDGAAL